MPPKDKYVKAKAPDEETRELTELFTNGEKEPTLTELPKDVDIDTTSIDPWTGLSERQIQIQSLRLRGMSQSLIAKIVKISQTMVFKELQRIKEIHKVNGVVLDRGEYVGKSMSIYEEIMNRAWEEYYAIHSDNPLKGQTRAQLMNLIMNAKEKQTKLLLDIGLLEKAKVQVEHSFRPSAPTLVDTWETEGRENLAAVILTSQLKELEAPKPPEEEILEAEFSEVTQEEPTTTEFDDLPKAEDNGI